MKRYWFAIPIAFAILLFAGRAVLHDDPLDNLAEQRGVYTGSIWVARGGPVIFGFASDGVGHLRVAGHDLRGAGLVKDRIVVPAGPLAIEFTPPPEGAYLVWSPVGRRGDPEYVAASSLSPDPPERALFDHPGTSPLDGVVAALLFATLLASILYAARRRLARVSRETWIAMSAVLVVALVARLVDLGGFGQAWDEDTNWASGRNYVTNLVGLDFSDRAWGWNFEHPPVMKLLDGIGAQFADGYGPARALSALWCSLGCMLLVPIGARLYRLRVGVLAALIAAFLPPLVAHGQIVGHESPTVLWWSLGILLALGVHDHLPEDPAAAARALLVRLAGVGAIVGIAIASRFVNGLLGPLVFAIVLIGVAPARRVRVLGWAAAVMPVAAIVAFVVVWPRMWPWHHPIDAIRASLAKLDSQHGVEPFLGAITNHPGPHYFLVYLWATLPIGVALALPLYAWRAIVRHNATALVVLLWFVIPLGVALSPVRQDGVRYVMPCLTAIAMMAAAGLDFVATKVRTLRIFEGAAAILVAYLVVVVVRIHPYYLDYFGAQVGGTETVQRRGWFETAWWGEGVDRAVAYVNDHAAANAPVFRDCILPAHLAWFRADLWTPMVHDPKRAAWIVRYSTEACSVPADARAVFEVEADGATLATVYQRP